MFSRLTTVGAGGPHRALRAAATLVEAGPGRKQTVMDQVHDAEALGVAGFDRSRPGRRRLEQADLQLAEGEDLVHFQTSRTQSQLRQRGRGHRRKAGAQEQRNLTVDPRERADLKMRLVLAGEQDPGQRRCRREVQLAWREYLQIGLGHGSEKVSQQPRFSAGFGVTMSVTMSLQGPSGPQTRG
jgi:hypothetical protein